MRKPKSTLETKLSEGQQAKLADLLLNGMPYHQAAEFVAKEFKVSVALSAFSSFWDRACVPVLLKRRYRAQTAADAIVEQATSGKSNMDAALINALKQKSLEILLKPDASAEEIAFVVSQALKVRDQDLKDRQTTLAESKYRDQVAASKAAIEKELGRAKRKGGLTPETMEAIERELKLL